MESRDTLGFEWNANVIPSYVPLYSLERVCFRYHRMLPEFVWDAISVPAAKALEFNEKMVRFYVNKDGTEMMEFLLGCQEIL